MQRVVGGCAFNLTPYLGVTNFSAVTPRSL
jgi:hypothetical protein